MKPKVLLIGRKLDVMKILQEELAKYRTDIVYANSIELIDKQLTKGI